MAGEKEEQYILRVQERTLADRIRKVLQEDPRALPADARMSLEFDGTPSALRHTAHAGFCLRQ
jgi:hypothetical protein